jgi:hypothetical protein
VAKRIPTEIGDVLILQTEKSFTVYVVGVVAVKNQQDFHGQETVKNLPDHTTAIATAKALVAPGRRIFLRNLDAGDWSEISVVSI